MLSKSLIVFCIAFYGAHSQETTGWKVGQEVKTSSGPIIGHPALLHGHKDVSEYLGIPYAAPPVGDLRWALPQPYKSNGTVQATKWVSSAPVEWPRKHTTNRSQGPGCPSASNLATADEDCLTLNVWTKPQRGEKKKAVLVSIYGGGFNTGQSNTRYLNGAPLANHEDVVVVSMNYRLNVLGFPGAPGLPQQNFGLYDIRASMEWVRDNIEAFGGDTKRITLFGESAGGGATDFYSFSWPKDPIAAGFIIQSGSVYTRGIVTDNNDDLWYKTTARLGCGGKEAGKEGIACMRTKKWRDVLANVNTGPRTPGETFGPIYDEVTVFKDYDAKAKRGDFAQKPILIGNTHNEGGFFQFLNQLNASEVHDMNRLFTCLAAKSAALRLPHDVPTWRYRFHDVYPNNLIAPYAGAFHGSELPFVFGTPKLKDNENKITDTPEETALTKIMMKAWADFARDPEKGLDKLGYPRYKPNYRTLIHFGLEAGKVTYGQGTLYDEECKTYEGNNDSIDGIIHRAKARGAKGTDFSAPHN